MITWTQTQAEALEQYALLLQRAVQVNIQFKLSKCVLFASEIELLGHSINQDGRKPNSKGIEAITAMKSPTNVTHAPRAVSWSLCVFRDYVPNMSDPTFRLRQLRSPFKWTQPRP